MADEEGNICLLPYRAECNRAGREESRPHGCQRSTRRHGGPNHEPTRSHPIQSLHRHFPWVSRAASPRDAVQTARLMACFTRHRQTGPPVSVRRPGVYRWAAVPDLRHV
jgi:hypothetical protein